MKPLTPEQIEELADAMLEYNKPLEKGDRAKKKKAGHEKGPSPMKEMTPEDRKKVRETMARKEGQKRKKIKRGPQ